MVGDTFFREGNVGSNPAQIDPELSLKDKWPRGDLLDGHQLELLLRALEIENLSHHDPPQPPTSIRDSPSSGSGARNSGTRSGVEKKVRGKVPDPWDPRGPESWYSV